MAVSLLTLILCAVITVAAVRFLVIRGIEGLCSVLKLSSKTKGQIIGYATSMPEFVVVLTAAFAGVREAGFWNIASSNVINWVLFLTAVLIYRQQLDLMRARFFDELVFGVLSVVVPLALLKLRIEISIGVCLALLGSFVLYRLIDRIVNPAGQEAPKGEGEARSGVLRALVLMAVGIAIVIAAGRFLGDSAQKLVKQVGTPAWLVGWVLGLITSIPELTSFFVIFRLHKKRDTLHSDRDTQEALDALVASNMCNLGLILPLGVILFALMG